MDPPRRASTSSRILVTAVLTALLAAAINAASAQSRWPEPFDHIRRHPWLWCVVLVVVIAVVEIWQGRAGGRRGGAQATGALTDGARPAAPPTSGRLAEIRRDVIRQVRATWIDDLLRRNLAEVARIELGLERRPEDPAASRAVRSGPRRAARDTDAGPRGSDRARLRRRAADAPDRPTARRPRRLRLTARLADRCRDLRLAVTG